MTRTPEDLEKLFAYGRWATAKMLESAAALGAEEFSKPIGGSFGSVQGTLAHLYGADWVRLAGQTWTYPIGEALVHVANHGTYHRGQVATLLRQLGQKAASTDYLRWIDAGSPR